MSLPRFHLNWRQNKHICFFLVHLQMIVFPSSGQKNMQVINESLYWL